MTNDEKLAKCLEFINSLIEYDKKELERRAEIETYNHLRIAEKIGLSSIEFLKSIGEV